MVGAWYADEVVMYNGISGLVSVNVVKVRK